MEDSPDWLKDVRNGCVCRGERSTLRGEVSAAGRGCDPGLKSGMANGDQAEWKDTATGAV